MELVGQLPPGQRLEPIQREDHHSQKGPEPGGRQGGGGREPSQENAPDEQGGHRRRDVADHLVDALEDAAELAHPGRPEDGGHHRAERDGPAHPHQRPVGGPRAPAFEQVVAEEGGDRVQGPGDRAHQRGQKGGGHHPFQTHRQQLGDHQVQRVLRVGLSLGRQGKLGQLALLDQGQADHARQHEDEHGQDLDEAGEQRSDPGVVLVLGPQHPLNDRLVGTPVPQPQHGIAQQDRIPGQVRGVAVRAEDAQVVAHLARRFRRLRGQARDGRLHPLPAADRVVADDRDRDRADQQHDRLDRFGEHHGHQPADDRVEAGDAGDGDDRQQPVLLRIVHDADQQEALQHDRPGIE